MQTSSLADETCTVPWSPNTCLSARGRVGWERRTWPLGPYPAVAIFFYFLAKLPSQRQSRDRCFIGMEPQKDHSALCVLPSKPLNNPWHVPRLSVLIQKTRYHGLRREEVEKPKTLLVSLVFKTETNVKIPVRYHNVHVAEETSSTASAHWTWGNIPSWPLVLVLA